MNLKPKKRCHKCKLLYWKQHKCQTKALPSKKQVLAELHELYLKEKEVLDQMKQKRGDWPSKPESDSEFNYDDWCANERIINEQIKAEYGIKDDEYHN